MEQPRSPHWHKVEEEHLKLEPKCACCGRGREDGVDLQVHHIFPFHYCIALGRPDLELDQRNLITLCENGAGKEDHHLLIGHLDDFKSSNLDVVEDAKVTFKGIEAAEIKASTLWQQKEKNRLKELDNMSEEEKEEFKTRMNSTYPLESEDGNG